MLLLSYEEVYKYIYIVKYYSHKYIFNLLKITYFSNIMRPSFSSLSFIYVTLMDTLLVISDYVNFLKQKKTLSNILLKVFYE